MKYKATLFSLACLLAPSAHAILSDTSEDAIYVNEYVGATAFYELGITGQGVTVANIELWSYDTDYLGFLQDDNYERYTLPGYTARANKHPSQTLGIMAGYVEDSENPELTTGLANGAYYYSAQVRNSSYTSATSEEIVNVYTEFFTSGIDVISSSWANAARDYDALAMGHILNSLAYDSATTTFVAAASNNGETGEGRTYEPYITSMNSITVGALSLDSGYTEVASYSSYGPSNFYNPITGETVYSVVSAIDIVAPGDMVASASTEDTSDTQFDQGTSFAAPTVASVVTLMKSYSKEYDMSEDTLDSRLVKAVLLNSATKLEGWDNGQSVVNGVITTTQSLDYTMGAGLVNAEQALVEYSAYGSSSHLDSIAYTSSIDYAFSITEADTQLTVTLCWFANDEASDITYTTRVEWYDLVQVDSVDLTQSVFADLDLELWGYDENGNEELIAISNSDYNLVEHLYLELEEGEYFFKVTFDDTAYGEIDTSYKETYGIAWSLTSNTIPEPSTATLSLLALTCLLARRRRK